MKSWWISGDVLELRDSPAPEPKAGEVLVRVRASSLNRGEFIKSIGLHQAGPEFKPAGQECAGEVIRVGAGVTGVKPGDRVTGRARGGFAEQAIIDAREVIPVPARMGWEQAAAIPLVFAVTYDMLCEQGHLVSGEWLLVTGVSSGVGVASLQAAKAMGAKVIGTSGSQAKLDRLKALGLDAGICTRKPDFAAKVKEITGGKGVNLVVNNVGGSVFAECMNAMAYCGRLATVGYVDGTMTAPIDLQALHSQRYVLFGVSNKHRGPGDRATTVAGMVRDWLPCFAEGRIEPVVDRVFPFAELPAAKAFMESDQQVGKIVVSLPD
jgi:NADPH2:quinone reductase